MIAVVLRAKNMKPYSHGGLKLQVVDDVLKGGRHEYLITSKGCVVSLEKCIEDYMIPFNSYIAEHIRTNRPDLKPELV